MSPLTIDWTLVLHAPGQHRYYQPTHSPDSSVVAVADMSMRTIDRPESTDDGLLYLDRSRPVRLIATGCTIPLLRPHSLNGRLTSSTPGTLREGVAVITKFGMQYTVDGQLEAVFDLFTKHPDKRKEPR